MTTFTGTPNADSLPGTAQSDLILGLQGNDTIVGNGGGDSLYGGQGADTIQYGVGAAAAGSTSSVLVYGGEGQDSIASIGSTGSNSVFGGTNNASIDVTADAADVIDVRLDTGTDFIFGNYGDDTILGQTVAAAVGGFGTTAIPTSDYIGGNGNDSISIAGGNSALILGNQGNDIIQFAGPNSTVYGGTGNDNITGTATGGNHNDVIFGSEGNDIINVNSGNNTILGGTGNAAIDSLTGAAGDGNDLISVGGGASGNDVILGNYGDDTIDASIQVAGGRDTLVGGMGNDVIFAGLTANNLILGNQGNDAISDTLSGAGTDTIYGGIGNDVVVAGSATLGANDLIYGSEGADSISVVGVGNDTVFGGVDSVGAGDGNNTIDLSGITGGVALGAMTGPRELVFGGAGSDSINIGNVVDIVTVGGGAGADTFSFQANAGSSSIVGGAGSGLDNVTDFLSGQDKFQLRSVGGASDFTPSNVFNAGSVSGADLSTAASMAIMAASQLQPGGSTTGSAATFTYSGSSDTYLVADLDMDSMFSAGADALIDIKGTKSLTKSDFA